MVAANLLKINLKNLIANFPALGFVEAVDSAINGHRRKRLFVIVHRGVDVAIFRPIFTLVIEIFGS